jgi:hypothetical protein
MKAAKKYKSISIKTVFGKSFISGMDCETLE